MTDNEIIKALKCCGNGGCSRECPFFKTGPVDKLECREELSEEVFGLICRQQDEIAKWRKRFNQQVDAANDVIRTYEEREQTIKNVAIKGFADKLKANRPHLNTGEQVFYIRPEAVDNLVKEMVGENDA